MWPTLPVDVSNILINAGLDRPELLGFAFENEDELEAFIPGVDKNVLSQLWSEALRAADVGVRREARVLRQQLSVITPVTPFTITSESQLNLAHPPMSSWFGASSSHQSGCRRKMCVLSPLPKLSDCSAVATSPRTRTIKHKVIEETPVSLMASKLWSRFVALGPRGTMWNEYVSIPMALRSEFRDLMVYRWSQFSLGQLRAATNAEDRWLRWAEQKHVDANPSPVTMAMFLKSLSGSPTAASGVASSLRFLELHVGYDFKMSSGCVAPWRIVDPRHVPVGKRPLTLAEWVQIESVADQVSCARRWLLLAWLALLGGVVRFAHIQRTELDEVDDSVGGLARRGKNRTGKPLPWSLPSTLLTRSFAVHFSELRDLSRKAGPI